MNLSELRDVLLNRPTYNKLEKEYIKQLKISACKLMKNYDTENDIEIKEIKRYPMFLWQEKLLNQFNLFVTMLGVLDAKIVNYEQLKKQNEEYDIPDFDLIYQKRKIIEERLFLLLYPHMSLNSLRESLKIIPCKNNTYNICREMKFNDTQYHLHKKFLDAYDIGYSLSLDIDLEKITPVFELIINEVDDHKEKNKLTSKKIKIRKINKKVN